MRALLFALAVAAATAGCCGVEKPGAAGVGKPLTQAELEAEAANARGEWIRPYWCDEPIHDLKYDRIHNGLE